RACRRFRLRGGPQLRPAHDGADPGAGRRVHPRARTHHPGQHAVLVPARVRDGLARPRGQAAGDHVPRGVAQRAARDVLHRAAGRGGGHRGRGGSRPAGRGDAAADAVVGQHHRRGPQRPADVPLGRDRAHGRDLLHRVRPQLPGRRRPGPVRRAGECPVILSRRRVAPVASDYHQAGSRLLDVNDLRTHFRTPRGMVRAVDGVSFSLDRGRTLGLVGESGCGKSVLSRSIMGLLPSTAERTGEIIFGSERIDTLGPEALRDYWGTQMAMVFQDPMTSLNPVMRIGNQITESLLVHTDMDKNQAKETALALLKSVHIPEAERRLKQYPHELSGGRRQRVVSAVALACGPQLLFADEPTTALDVTVQAQILDLLSEQQRERHMAVVLVSHDLGVVAGRTQEIAVMYAGQIVEQAPTSVLFSEVRMPYTEALLRSVPRLENPSHT